VWTVEAMAGSCSASKGSTVRTPISRRAPPDVSLLARDSHHAADALTPSPAEHAPELAAQWDRLAAWRRLRRDPPADLHPWSRANLDWFVRTRRAGVLSRLWTGASLAHTDLHSLNLRVVGRRLHVVDWARSRRAAPMAGHGFRRCSRD